jgi:UDP-3-O-[3-hydroxymyristoyl] glucosamine N-acyltransferase
LEIDIETILLEQKIEFDSQGPKKIVKGFSSITEATQDQVSFCWYDEEKGLDLISQTKAGVILCKKNMKRLINPKPGIQYFFLDNPRLVYIHIINLFFKNKKREWISPTAQISKTAKIGNNCHIGNFVIIGDNCVIGANTILGDRVSVIQNCSIGNNCIIQSGTVIGEDGFAFERYSDGTLVRFPHIKGVKIGDNVEISTNSSIARGSLSDTVIGNGTKIDALVHVAHNVVIGENCELTAGTIIGGSTRIGDMSWIGLNSTLKDNIIIGKKVIIGAGAAVINDVPTEDIVAGVPARSIKDKVTSNQLFLMAGQQNRDTSKY